MRQKEFQIKKPKNEAKKRGAVNAPPSPTTHCMAATVARDFQEGVPPIFNYSSTKITLDDWLDLDYFFLSARATCRPRLSVALCWRGDGGGRGWRGESVDGGPALSAIPLLFFLNSLPVAPFFQGLLGKWFKTSSDSTQVLKSNGLPQHSCQLQLPLAPPPPYNQQPGLTFYQVQPRN